MRFVLVHHGDVAIDPLAHAAAGHDDPPLSDAGRLQAQAAAAELHALAGRGERHAAVLSSPFRAAQDAASVIAATLGLPPPELRDELVTLTPETLPDDDGAVEALTLLQERAWSVIEELKQRQEMDQTLILVTHELTIRALVCRSLSMPLSELRRFRLEPGSLTTIDYRMLPRERTLLASLNETCHLEPPPA